MPGMVNGYDSWTWCSSCSPRQPRKGSPSPAHSEAHEGVGMAWHGMAWHGMVGPLAHAMSKQTTLGAQACVVTRQASCYMLLGVHAMAEEHATRSPVLAPAPPQCAPCGRCTPLRK